MPSRWLRLVIVVFWLCMTGWLVWHDLWPDWRPGEPPPFHIDLVEEVQKGIRLRTTWAVRCQRRQDAAPVKVFTAYTWATYDAGPDEFTLHSEFVNRSFRDTSPYLIAGMFKVESLKSKYCVDRAGRLRSLWAEVSASLAEQSSARGPILELFLKRKPKPTGDRPFQRDPESELNVQLWGEVRDGQFFGHCQGRAGTKGREFRMDLPPADVSSNGSLLMPLHPVNRLRGLRPGQAWRQPLVDPFRDAFAALPGMSGGVRYVNAHVLPETQVLEWEEGARADCLVVEYESEGATVGRTWVERDSELVQQQEAYLDGDHWIMRRDARKAPGRAF